MMFSHKTIFRCHPPDDTRQSAAEGLLSPSSEESSLCQADFIPRNDVRTSDTVIGFPVPIFLSLFPKLLVQMNL